MYRKPLYALTVLILLAVGFYGLHSQGSQEVNVVQCTNQIDTCYTAVITDYRTECKPFSPWSDRSELDCNITERNIERVSMVTDPANYIREPIGDQDYGIDVLNRTGEHPWDLEFLPSGDHIWTNKDGTIRVYDGQNVEKIDELDVISDYELGLLGLAVDPDFEDNRYIYVYYTGEKTDRDVGKLNKTLFHNYVVRYRLTEEGLVDRKRLIELPGSKYHSGGRLEFGPDDRLYITTGESGMFYKASNRSNLAGKILRINPDGSIPEDNPFNNSVYSMGHRNPQGLAWSPSGQLYNSEHGQWRHDEINRIEPGEKYGWSGYKCDEKKRLYSDFTEKIEDRKSYYDNNPPVHCFEEWTMAPSGATFVNDTENPWHGDLFVAGLRGKHIHRFEFEEGEIVENEIFYTSKDDPSVGLRMRDVEYRNGSLYAISDIRGMVRITPE